MSKQPWLQGTIARGAGAALLVAAMLVSAAAGAQPIGDNPTPGVAHQIVTFGDPDEGPEVDELDPTDDGSIIIKCVCFTGPAAVNANEPPRGTLMHAVAVPQFPLGPSNCSSKEHRRA